MLVQASKLLVALPYGGPDVPESADLPGIFSSGTGAMLNATITDTTASSLSSVSKVPLWIPYT